MPMITLQPVSFTGAWTESNVNSLIRQYLVKGKELQDLRQRNVLAIMDKLKDRPRKYLGYKIPNRVFLGLKLSIVLTSTPAKITNEHFH